MLSDVVSWHSIFDSDRCWHHDAWLLFEARVLTWNGRISDEIWISTLCDCNLGLKTLKLVRQLCYFFVLDVCCVGIRLSQCPSRRAIILQDAASEPSESLDSFAITWKVTRLNDIFGQPLRVTPGLWTPFRQGRWTWWHRGLKTAVDGGTRFAHGTCCLCRSFLATWWCYNVVCLGMQAIASLWVYTVDDIVNIRQFLTPVCTLTPKDHVLELNVHTCI